MRIVAAPSALLLSQLVTCVAALVVNILLSTKAKSTPACCVVDDVIDVTVLGPV